MRKPSECLLNMSRIDNYLQLSNIQFPSNRVIGLNSYVRLNPQSKRREETIEDKMKNYGFKIHGANHDKLKRISEINLS